MPPMLQQLSPEAYLAGCVVTILVGLVECFLGYRLFKLMLALVGFVVGAIGAGGAAYAATGGEGPAALIAGLIGGIFGAVLAVVFYFVGIFLLGAALGFVVGATAAASAGDQTALIAGGVLAVLAGILALVVQKFLIILSTAFGGAWSAALGVFGLAHGRRALMRIVQHPDTMTGGRYTAYVVAWVVLGIVGILVQYGVTARNCDHRPRTRRT